MTFTLTKLELTDNELELFSTDKLSLSLAEFNNDNKIKNIIGNILLTSIILS